MLLNILAQPYPKRRSDRVDTLLKLPNWRIKCKTFYLKRRDDERWVSEPLAVFEHFSATDARILAKLGKGNTEINHENNKNILVKFIIEGMAFLIFFHSISFIQYLTRCSVSEM